jgi:hypothetical protein
VGELRKVLEESLTKKATTSAPTQTCGECRCLCEPTRCESSKEKVIDERVSAVEADESQSLFSLGSGGSTGTLVALAASMIGNLVLSVVLARMRRMAGLAERVQADASDRTTTTTDQATEDDSRNESGSGRMRRSTDEVSVRFTNAMAAISMRPEDEIIQLVDLSGRGGDARRTAIQRQSTEVEGAGDLAKFPPNVSVIE